MGKAEARVSSRAGHELQEPEREGPAKRPGRRQAAPLGADAFHEPTLVGSFFWKLARGDQWVFGPESAFVFRDCWREMLVREAYMLEHPSTPRERWWDALKTVGRRWLTGEPFLLDLYVAEKDGAELAISSDEIGGNLYITQVEEHLICRKAVYFGSEVDVMLRVTSPLEEGRSDEATARWSQRLKRAAYGPGWIFQRFLPRPGGTRNRIILQIDGALVQDPPKPKRAMWSVRDRGGDVAQANARRNRRRRSFVLQKVLIVLVICKYLLRLIQLLVIILI